MGQKLHQLLPIIVVLFVIFILRIPSLFEPYWYGDEGIYFAIGQAMQKGAVLYRDIWDNKPPLLYVIYAISPTILWAKLSATGFVLGTVYFIYKLVSSVFLVRKPFLPFIFSLIGGVLLSVPLFEGTIANAELYFNLAIAAGAYLVYTKLILHDGETRDLILIGTCFSLAFWLKIPSFFDFAGIFLAYVIITKKIPFKKFLVISLPFLVTLIIVLLYFTANQALSYFFTASLSQNASYVAIDAGPFSQISNPLFVRGFLLLISLIVVALLHFKKKVSREFLFLFFWFSFSLYGALLSNRPYLHYLLQIVPPTVVLCAYILRNLSSYWLFLFPAIYVVSNLYAMFGNGFCLPVKPYYQNFINYTFEKISFSNYANFFDSRTTTNYVLGNYIAKNSSATDTMFYWGDNAFYYVLSTRLPATKFIQAHHLTTIPKINFDLIIKELLNKKPKFVIVTRPIHFSFPALETLVEKNYSLAMVIDNHYLYKIK